MCGTISGMKGSAGELQQAKQPSRAVSCNACRRSKLRCERIFPCARCVKLRIPCEDPQANAEEEQLARQLSVRYGLARLGPPRHQSGTHPVDMSQLERCRPKRINRGKALIVLRELWRVQSHYSFESMRPMLLSWASALGVDPVAACQAAEPYVMPPDGTQRPELSFLYAPFEHAQPSMLLHPILHAIFGEAFISFGWVYRRGMARVFANRNWAATFFSEYEIQRTIQHEQRLPEEICASVIHPDEREYFAACLDQCLFGADESLSEVVHIMQCVSPRPLASFQALMNLRVVVLEGYVGFMMSLQVLPVELEVTDPLIHRSSFKSAHALRSQLVAEPPARMARKRPRKWPGTPPSEQDEKGSVADGATVGSDGEPSSRRSKGGERDREWERGEAPPSTKSMSSLPPPPSAKLQHSISGDSSHGGGTKGELTSSDAEDEGAGAGSALGLEDMDPPFPCWWEPPGGGGGAAMQHMGLGGQSQPQPQPQLGEMPAFFRAMHAQQQQQQPPAQTPTNNPQTSQLARQSHVPAPAPVPPVHNGNASGGAMGRAPGPGGPAWSQLHQHLATMMAAAQGQGPRGALMDWPSQPPPAPGASASGDSHAHSTPQGGPGAATSAEAARRDREPRAAVGAAEYGGPEQGYDQPPPPPQQQQQQQQLEAGMSYPHGAVGTWVEPIARHEAKILPPPPPPPNSYYSQPSYEGGGGCP